MNTFRVSRPSRLGTRWIYIGRNRPKRDGDKNCLGTIELDWCPDDSGKMVMGYFWCDMSEGYGKTFPRLRDCVADFERVVKERSKKP